MKFGRTIFLLPLIIAVTAQANEIRIAASDLLAEYIEEPLAAYGKESETTLKVEGVGSLPALDRLRSDEIDLAIIAIPQGGEVPEGEFSIYPFAYDVAVLIVNVNNPIDEISLDYLGGIFGTSEEFSFNTWGEIGLSGWQKRNIKAFSGTSEESIALELFKHSVFKAGSMKAGVARVKPNEVIGLVSEDVASIAILSQMPEGGKVKVLMVSSADDSSDADLTAFGPSDDNVHYGDYPIRLAFYMVYKKRDEAKLREVVRVLLNDGVAQSLQENHLVALPDTIRRKLLSDLDL